MTGKILFYNSEAQAGVISAEDGKRYDFIAAEVMGGENSILQGGEVDFELSEEGIPLGICVTTIRQPIQSSSSIAVETIKPQIILTPWFHTLIEGPMLLVFFIIAYYSFTAGTDDLSHVHMKNIFKNFDFYLLFLPFVMTYIRSKVNLMPFNYTPANVVDNMEKKSKIGLFSFNQKGSQGNIGLAPLVSLFGLVGFAFDMMYLFFLPVIGFLIYFYLLEKDFQIPLLRDIHNADKGNDIFDLSFEPQKTALMAAPGITFIMLFLLISFGGNLDGSEGLAFIFLMSMLLAVAAGINALIKAKKFPPFARVYNQH